MFKNANLLLLGVIILGFCLRLPLLTGSFWLDEAAQALESARPFSQQLQIIPDFQPPLFHLLIHFALLFGQSEWWLRLIGALIPGLITIWSTFKIGTYLQSKRVGLMASLLLATNSLHIFFAQELRPYSLAAMWAVLSWLLLIKMNDHQINNKNQSLVLNSYFLFLIFSILGIFTTYLYPFLFFAQWVYVLLVSRKLVKKMAIATVAVILSFLPWLSTFLQQLHAGGLVRTGLPGWSEVVSFNQIKSIPMVLGKFTFGVIDLNLNFWIFLTLLTLITWLFFIIWSVRDLSSNFLHPKNRLYLIWLLAPLVSSWLISFWIPVIQPKRLLFLLPVFYLLIASLIEQINLTPDKKSFSRSLITLPFFLLFFINLWSTAQYHTQAKLQRENWRSLHQQIITQYPASNSMVLMSAPEPFAPWTWYERDNRVKFPALATGTLSVSQLESVNETLKPALDKQYILVFDYLRTLSDPDDKILTALKTLGYQEVGALDRPGIGFVRIYVKRTGTLS